jgi:hypothetical protein
MAVPEILLKNRFPGQEHTSGTTKIPSVLMYDQMGELQAAGAEALLDENVYKAETEGWIKAEWRVVCLCHPVVRVDSGITGLNYAFVPSQYR